jgi:hypothetical protein
VVGVALAVSEPLRVAFVELPGVQLEDRLVLGEQGVDFVAVDVGVEDRDRQTVLCEPREERNFTPRWGAVNA